MDKHRLKRVRVTEEEAHICNEEMVGFCMYCGNEQSGCEPDARKYQCEACEKLGVYGFSELMLMGLVDIVEEPLEEGEVRDV